MIILMFLLCFITNILAYQRYGNMYGRNFYQNSVTNENVFDNNFSEDEMNAINEYKKSRHFRDSVRNTVFDPPYENRRLFGWVKKLLRKEEPKPIKYEDLVNNKIFYLHLTSNLTDNLGRLTNVLDQFTRSLKEKSIINATLRRARSVNDSVYTDNSTNNKSIDNKTTLSTEDNISTIQANVGERQKFNSLEFKDKLIASINETLNVILYKVETVSNTQKIFGDNILFNIGFISGSVYSMKGFIVELQSTVGRNQAVLDEKYIMQLYDTVNKVNHVSGKLMEQLNLFVNEASK